MQSHEAAITSGELMRIAGEGIATRCLQAEGLLSVASRAGELRTEHGYGDIRLDLATPEGNSNGQGVFLFKYQAGLDVIECSSAASCGAITYAEEIPYDSGEATPERIGRMAQAVVSVGDRRGSGVHSLEDTFCDYAFGPHSKFAIGRTPSLVTVFGGLSVLGARLAAEAATGRDTQAAVSFGIIPDNFRAIMDVSSLDDALTTQLVATDVSLGTEVSFASHFGRLTDTEAAVCATLTIAKTVNESTRTMSFRLDQWGGDLLVGVEHTFSGEIERQELHAAVPDAIARMAGVVVAFAQGVTVDEALHASDFVEHGYRVSKLVA